MAPDSLPQISVLRLVEKLKSRDKFVLLDVRETWELERARIEDARLEVRPASRLAREGIDCLPASVRPHDAEVYILCHHGVRSAQVADWLVSQGWTNVFSVSGGIDEYARTIDRSVGSY
jgi:rhodanese-related sulfurtransferase